MENLKRHGAFGGKGRGESRRQIRMGAYRPAENDENAAQEETREHRLRVSGQPLAANHQCAEKHNGGVGQQNLAKPNVIPRDAVMKPKLEHAAQKISHNQRQRCGVRP